MLLRTVDILIGLSVIMLLVSMSVTVLTQMVMAARNWRGKHLLDGIESIVLQVHPDLRAHAREIGSAVLTHPLISQVNGKLGGVIQREELVRILLELAAAGPAPAQPMETSDTLRLGWHAVVRGIAGETKSAALTHAARQALEAALRARGVADPAETLQNIHLLALKLEASHPETASHLRQTVAIIQEASSDFVARVHSWFDETMDRVTQKYTNNARKVTAVCALSVAIILQLDSLALLRRLAVDEEFRKGIASQSAEVMRQYENDPQSRDRKLADIQRLSAGGYDLWPHDWFNAWSLDKIPGILLSWALLSLGAPFWYNALKNLVRLRPLLSSKEDDVRNERQTEQKVVAAPAAAIPLAAVVSGERGDLGAGG